MTSGKLWGFTLGAAVAAAAGAIALTPWWIGGDPIAAGWAATGFLAMVLPGVAGGAWLAREHGRPGSRFVVALGAGFVARLVLAAIAAYAAAKAGEGAPSGLLAGLAAGFVPLQVFEVIWFTRPRAEQRIGTETRG